MSTTILVYVELWVTCMEWADARCRANCVWVTVWFYFTMNDCWIDWIGVHWCATNWECEHLYLCWHSLPIAGSVNCTHTHWGNFWLWWLHSMNLMWHSAPLIIPSDTARLAVTSYSYPTFSTSVNGKLPVLFTCLFLAAAKIAFCIFWVMSVRTESMASTIIVICNDCFSMASLYAVVLSWVGKKCGTSDITSDLSWDIIRVFRRLMSAAVCSPIHRQFNSCSDFLSSFCHMISVSSNIVKCSQICG